MSEPLRICLVPYKSSWMGGAQYVRTLARGISMLADSGKVQVSVDIFGRKTERLGFEIGRIIADGLPFVPLRWCNPKRYDFVYPYLAGKRAPYQWGAWIPDFQELHLPHLFTPEMIEERRERYKCMADRAPVIIVSSEMASGDFAQLFPDAAERCRVLRFPSYVEPELIDADPLPIQQKYNLPDRFFIVCNQFWMHKDHRLVFQALSHLLERGIRPTIVCTGNTVDHRNPGYFTELTAIIDSLGIREQVKILGQIPRIEQIQLIRRSLAVIQPSLFEGWSTVVEDARSLAKPILLSDFPVHREQNPPSARFFETSNAEALAQLIETASLELEPGPNAVSEQTTVLNSAKQTASFGESFIAIIRETLT